MSNVVQNTAAVFVNWWKAKLFLCVLCVYVVKKICSGRCKLLPQI